ncbi:MAG: PorT family protein [Fibrobacter sp.]|nr:PorT family protein [Fibrobacter sp.]
MFKKIILAALVVTSAVFAQINVGGRAALNFGTVWGENTDDANWGLGFNAGVVAKMGINPMLSFVPGLEVDYRRISNDEGEYTQSISFMYIEAPLLLRIQATPQFAIDVGPTVAFNVSASIGASDGDNSASADIPSDYVTAVEVGAVVGVSFAVMPNLEVNVRAAMGFMDMLDMKKMMMGDDDDYYGYDYVPDFGFKNMRFQAGVTYWFM